VVVPGRDLKWSRPFSHVPFGFGLSDRMVPGYASYLALIRSGPGRLGAQLDEDLVRLRLLFSYGVARAVLAAGGS
jgi:hypothetical protein